MKKIFLFIVLWAAIADIRAQNPPPDNNGLNLEDLCEWPECLYANFPIQVSFPDDSVLAESRWRMANLEMALKDNGYFLLTGDFYVTQEELGAVFELEIMLYN
ncbi:hypothetical protein [Reichenbachiella ulvae]|uniref:Uncharacterized protein n=1 Tax=Reichenbachiella ulvae TaxID=2980104 RepID=A0ABT3CRD2_9BACT|nr:hypothetical protein [Reichenbachiella ulvae]MCV9386167.1 hypothetical protein [Reichenbachiella ulvae]